MTATETDPMIQLAAERGYTLVSAHEPADVLKKKADKYLRWAKAAGHRHPLKNLTNARFVYVADSKKQGMDDLRPAVTHEMDFQRRRGLLKFMCSAFHLPFTPEEATFDAMVEAGVYNVGDPDTIAERLKRIYDEGGGFGTLLIVTGKDWATREKRARSMRLFMEQVAPQLRDLEATREA